MAKPKTDPNAPLKYPKMLPAEGYVWCHEHGQIHEDTNDPFGYGKPDCSKAEHRPVFFRAKRGDYP